MYGMFNYIYHKNQPHVGKYTSPMDPLGYVHIQYRDFQQNRGSVPKFFTSDFAILMNSPED